MRNVYFGADGFGTKERLIRLVEYLHEQTTAKARSKLVG